MLTKLKSFYIAISHRLQFKESIPFLLFLSLASFIIELILGLDLISGRLEILPFLFWHGTVSAVLAIFAMCCVPRQFTLILFAFVFSMGPTGSMLAMAIVFLSFLLKPFTPPIESLLEDIAPDVAKSASQTLFEKIYYKQSQFEKEEETLSFADIMSYGSLTQKRLAIEKMLRYFRPEFTPLLRKATRSSKNVLRVQAATALQALDHQFHERMIFLSQKAQNPNGTPEDWLLYAIHCKNYAESGIADEERYHLLLEASVVSFEKIKSLGNPDPSLYYALAQLYHASNQKHLALENAEKCIETENPSFDEAVYLIADIFFEQKEYQKLRELVTRYLPKVRELESGKSQTSFFLSPWSTA